MILPKRLEIIAEMAKNDEKVFDIGTDHALIPIYLKLHYDVNVIGVDNKEKVLNGASKMLQKYDLIDKIPLVLSDGLDNGDVHNSTLIIAGMGTSTILHILNNNKTNFIRKMIIQSNNDLYLLRKKVLAKGFMINKEEYIKENNKDYIIIEFIKGKQHLNKYALMFGYLIKDKTYFKNLIKKKEQVLNLIPKTYFLKRINLLFQIRYLKKLT
jgi:tRNA A22 N-methylase